MRKLVIENKSRIKRAVPIIESKIKIHISVEGNYANISGNEVSEFLAEEVVKAIDFGFDPRDALLLIKDDFSMEFINIKEHTKRKNLKEVRSRVIGREGKAKNTIEELTGGVMVVHGNMVGLIVDSEHREQAVQGIILLIQGAKHGNVFAYLEKQNANLRYIDTDDLGLKNPKKDLVI